VKLDRRGQEYCRFPVAGAPPTDTPLEVSFDDGATWAPMAWNADETAVTVLVCGPDTAAPAGVVLALGRNVPTVRLVDSPETVIRSTGGSIDVT